MNRDWGDDKNLPPNDEFVVFSAASFNFDGFETVASGRLLTYLKYLCKCPGICNLSDPIYV